MKNNMLDGLKKIIFLFFVDAISISAFARGADVLSAIHSYSYKDGKPNPISQIYHVDEPLDGFQPYYIYLNFSRENACPFIFNMEGIKGGEAPYTRCNVAFNTNEKIFIPLRKYESGFAEDSEPCLGFSEPIKIIKGKGGMRWFLTKAVYKVGNGANEIADEVYFYDYDKFCFSQDISSSLSSGEISVKKLKEFSLGNKAFTECSDKK